MPFIKLNKSAQTLPVFNMSYNVKAAFTCALVSVLLLILAGPIHQIQGLSSGAPEAACGSMTPGHGVGAQTSTSPFVTLVSDKMVSTNTPIMMDLHPSNNQNHFKGYLVMAFDLNDNSVAIGTFKQRNNGKLISCGSLMNAATHSDSSPKTSVKLEWTPPPDYSGQVIFRTTFVKDKTTFWVKIESETVTIGGAPSTASTTTAPVTPKKSSAPSHFVSVTCGNLIFLSLLIFLVR